MSTPDNVPQERPENGVNPGHYGEVAPGVPRYGQYAPEGWVPPSAANDAGPATGVPASPSYPGFTQQHGAGYPGNGGFPAGPVASRRPRQVVLATTLIMIAGALQAFSGFLLIVAALLPAARNVVGQELKAAMPSSPEYDSILNNQTTLISMLFIAAAISLIGAAIYFFLAFKMRGGASWARTTGMVLAAISLLALLQPNVFTILQIGLGVAAMVILYRSPAKEFFLKKGPGPRSY